MNHFFDSHCHLYFPDFAPDLAGVIGRARTAGVEMLTIGTCVETSRRNLELAEANEGVYAAVGIHPNDTGNAGLEAVAELRRLATGRGKVLAIGEIGLDYYRDRAPRERQKEFFLRQLDLAAELDKPVVLHARDSGEDLLQLVEPFIKAGGQAVWHCFTGPKRELNAQLDRALALGLYIGISGMITFPDQERLREAVLRVPDCHLLLDTDSPFLTPKPAPRGERNEPANCQRIAEELARLRQVRLEDIARITRRNAREFLKLDVADAGKIAYQIRNSLYLGLTNRCNNNCLFCARNDSYVVKGHDIRLSHDPSTAEVLAAMGDTSRYEEVVFCGFGEPTLRLEVLKAVAGEMKKRGQVVRLNTNGLANLEYGRDIVPELAGLVDVVSVSLNTAQPAQYQELCRSRFGDQAFAGMCDFVRRCLKAGLRTVCTVVEMPDIDIEAARRLAVELGAEFRVRSFVDAG